MANEKSFSMCFPFLDKATVTSPFGLRKSPTAGASTNHTGIDLDLRTGGNTTVVSCVPGTVTKTGYNKYRGNYVVIAGVDSYSTIYQHLAKISVKKGDSVYCKTQVGVQGATGISSAPHLHFEVCSTIDPGQALSQKYSINPCLYWGLNDYYNIKNKVLDGSGMITGNVSGNPNVASVVESSSSSTVITSSTYSSSISNQLIPSGEYYQVDRITGVSEDWLYGRRYRVFVDLGSGKAFDISQLRCKFEIVKSYTRYNNVSSVSIYNLNPNDENTLIKEGQRIVIEAGYNGSQYGKIFDGNVIQPVRSKEGNTDYVLKLLSMDSDRYLTYGLIGVSLVAQQSMRDAIDTLSRRSSVVTQEGFISEQQIMYPRGKVMFGKSTYYLDQISKTMNAAFYPTDGTINIVKASDLPSNTILDLGPESGLVGNPTQTTYGISFSCLLNPRIDINALVHIDNSKINNAEYSQGTPVYSLDSEGIYRVVKLTHSGDTRGDDWVTRVEAISQAGLLPGMAAGNDVSIY